jgi:hypothetical protein
MQDAERLSEKFAALWPLLDERSRRLTAAVEAMSLGRGGVSAVNRACGLSRQVISKGIKEIEEGAVVPTGRIRRSGGGRKAVEVHDPGIVAALDDLLEVVLRCCQEGLTLRG